MPQRGGHHGSGFASRVTPKLIVRLGRAEDRSFVEDLGKRTLVDSVAAFRDYNTPMLDVAFERLLLFVYDQPHELSIAEMDGRRVGFILLLTTLPDEVTLLPQGFVAYMSVEPDARRSGAGSALLQSAEEIARARGLPYMALMVTEDNIAARNLYDSAGYITERRLLCKIL